MGKSINLFRSTFNPPKRHISRSYSSYIADKLTSFKCPQAVVDLGTGEPGSRPERHLFGGSTSEYPGRREYY